jgi:hypothetical protein
MVEGIGGSQNFEHSGEGRLCKKCNEKGKEMPYTFP